MSHFADGQMFQLGNALEAAGWTAEDVTRLGQATQRSLDIIRESLEQDDIIISSIQDGRSELWLHPGQVFGRVRGQDIFEHLIEKNLLDDCADLRELKIIRSKGVLFFRKHFGEKKVLFAWRGESNGRVPCMGEVAGKVEIAWYSLAYECGSTFFALRFVQKK